MNIELKNSKKSLNWIAVADGRSNITVLKAGKFTRPVFLDEEERYDNLEFLKANGTYFTLFPATGDIQACEGHCYQGQATIPVDILDALHKAIEF